MLSFKFMTSVSFIFVTYIYVYVYSSIAQYVKILCNLNNVSYMFIYRVNHFVSVTTWIFLEGDYSSFSTPQLPTNL